MRVTKGDNGNDLSFAITDEKGKVDLTGASVQLFVSVKGESEKIKEVTIINAKEGLCTSLLDGDLFKREGVALVRVKVSFASGKIFNSDLQQIIIDN